MRKKAKAIVIVARTIVRTSSIPAKNPIVLTEEPLSNNRPWFRITAIRVGSSLSIGLADENVTLDNGALLGYQSSTNCAYVDYINDSNNRTSGICTSGKINNAPQLNSGDVIDIKVDFNKKTVDFWRNQTKVGTVAGNLVEGAVFPAVSISFDSEIIISNDPMPDYVGGVVKVPTKLFDSAPSAPTNNSNALWSWGRRAAAIEISNGVATRSEAKGVKNPIILTSEPFSPSKPWCRFVVTSIGDWIAVGVTEGTFPLINAKVLGEEVGYFNAAYFDQHGKNMRRISVCQAKTNLSGTKVEVGDTIDVKVDYNSTNVRFWKNGQYLGQVVLPSTGATIYPVAQLSTKTGVSIAPGPMPNLQNY